MKPKTPTAIDEINVIERGEFGLYRCCAQLKKPTAQI